ncbi:MAG TPA: hypothetical protein VFI91_01970 [Longimicrobiaceae bacterium]|nr:hypothetical protein [Longimicrobiaceae bacterium]
MKRLLTSAAAAAMLVAGTGSGAQAQAGASLFDLGVYGGVGYSANWLENANLQDGEETLNPGFSGALGAMATFWATPSWGIRTHLGYMPLTLPSGDQESYADPEDVNLWIYDLNLVVRPFMSMTGSPPLITSMYAFIGGGGLTANPPGPAESAPEDDGGCVAPYFQPDVASACLPLEGSKASVGQGTLGIGWDLISLSDNIGIFAELAGNIYDSPFHTGPAWTGIPGDPETDALAFTGRLVAGLKFAFGGAEPVVVPVPVTPTPPPPPAPAPPPPPAERDIRVCVIEGPAIVDVDAVYVPATGDTVVVVDGVRRPFSEAYPAVAPAYAASTTWFINNDSIQVMDNDYVKFGVTRVVPATRLQRVGAYEGVGIFAETGAETPQQILYVPVRPGCEFQPYQLREAIRARG